MCYSPLEAAFSAFGGVPRQLLFDQRKAVVIDDERLGGGKRFANAAFLRFAAHAYAPLVPATPAIERPVLPRPRTVL